MRRSAKWLAIRAVALSALFIMGLGLAPAQAGKVNVIATISIIGDVVKNVAGDAVSLVVLVGPDGDAHEYEPVPADSVNISKADIIFENGLHLEHWLDKLYSASGSKARRIVFRSPGFSFDFNPRKSARYSRKISFFSCSSLRLYFGICATVSMVNKFTQNRPHSFFELTYICSPKEA